MFQKLSEYSLYVKCENLFSAKTFVECLGHIIDKQGKRPSESSSDAIKLLRRPQIVSEAHAFLEKINLYRAL